MAEIIEWGKKSVLPGLKTLPSVHRMKGLQVNGQMSTTHYVIARFRSIVRAALHGSSTSLRRSS